MKNIFLIIGFLIVSQFSAQSLKVMTYNLRLSVDSDKENSWENRKMETMALIAYYHPDILGVQEALPQQMSDLNKTLVGYKSVGVGRDDGKNKGEFSAIFYDESKLKILKSGTFWLSPTPDLPSKGWDAALNRICTYALFQDKKSGKKFWSFNTHFDHLGNIARINSSKLILEKIKILNTEKLPVVLTGDFNLTDDSEPLKILAQQMSDTFVKSEKPHYGPTGTFQDFDVNTPAKDRIDYIFTNRFRIISNRTIDDRRKNLLYPSDHFPVLSEIISY